MHCTGPVAVNTLSPTITLGASAPAPLVVVVVVGVLLDVEDVLVDALVVALLSVLEVVVVVAPVEVSAVEAVVVVVVLLELEALVPDDVGVTEVFAGTGIDWVHEDMPAATTRAPTTTDTWRRHLRSAIRCPPPAPRNPSASARSWATAPAQYTETFDLGPKVQSIVHTPLAKE
jgi:hypothetical protein